MSQLKFPYPIIDVESKAQAELKQDYSGHKNGFVQVGPEKWLYPKTFQENALYYYNLQPRPDDVWIVSFPRSGTTLNQEILWLLANDLDYEKAARIPLETRFPFLEYSMQFSQDTKKQLYEQNKHSGQRLTHLAQVVEPAWQFFEKTTERRFIKTHLPLQLLSPNLLDVGCKVLYVARNPKDVAVSFYHCLITV